MITCEFPSLFPCSSYRLDYFHVTMWAHLSFECYELLSGLILLLPPIFVICTFPPKYSHLPCLFTISMIIYIFHDFHDYSHLPWLLTSSMIIHIFHDYSIFHVYSISITHNFHWLCAKLPWLCGRASYPEVQVAVVARGCEVQHVTDVLIL